EDVVPGEVTPELVPEAMRVGDPVDENGRHGAILTGCVEPRTAPSSRVELAAPPSYCKRMLPRLSYDGAVDADGHVLEPPDLWDRELESRFRDRPMGIRRDGEGREYLEVAGRPSKMVRNNLPQALGAMDLIGGIPAPAGRARTGLGYLDNAGLGA